VRLLVAIPHYFNPEPGYHGSRRHAPQFRRWALTTVVSGLHQMFGPRQYRIELEQVRGVQANDAGANTVDIVICTTRGKHLLDDVELSANAYTHLPTDAEPKLLGYECHAVLRDGLGSYDYYCHVEDDLVIHDPWFFAKLAWFTELAGDTSLLQPNRYEVDNHFGGRKAYIDGYLGPKRTEGLHDPSEEPELTGEVLGRKVRFWRPANPHSACYFLNEAQMARWAAQPYFLDRSAAFVAEIESSATLGIMRTFKLYKASLECASFFEIEHIAQIFISAIDHSDAAASPPLAWRWKQRSRDPFGSTGPSSPPDGTDSPRARR
jgi:hypothetical protein